MNKLNELTLELEMQLKTLNEVKLTPKQLFKTSNISRDDFLNYLSSLQGNKKRIYGMKKYSSEYAIKSGNTYKKLFDGLINPVSSHKPYSASKKQWYGVEIECLIPTDEEKYLIDDNGDENEEANDCFGDDTMEQVVNDLNRMKLPRVNVKTDGSIKEIAGYCGMEFNILCNADDGYKNLFILCEYLNNIGAIVNKSCGMHVHIDHRNTTKIQKRVSFDNLTSCVKAFAEIMPESRKNNRYCNLIGSMTERYSAVNGTTLKKYNTIEIRLHSSTIDFTKIVNWIELLTIVNNLPKRIGMNSNTLEELFINVNIPEKLIEYCLARRDKFMGKNEVQETATDEMLQSIAA